MNVCEHATVIARTTCAIEGRNEEATSATPIITDNISDRPLLFANEEFPIALHSPTRFNYSARSPNWRFIVSRLTDHITNDALRSHLFRSPFPCHPLVVTKSLAYSGWLNNPRNNDHPSHRPGTAASRRFRLFVAAIVASALKSHAAPPRRLLMLARTLEWRYSAPRWTINILFHPPSGFGSFGM